MKKKRSSLSRYALLALALTGSFSLALAGGLEAWRTEQFGANASTPSIAGNDADPDFDGFRNLMEYAVGSDPNRPSMAGFPETKTEMIGGSEYLTLTYQKLRVDILYGVEISGNLVNWTGIADSPAGTQGGYDLYKASVATGADSKNFLRLNVAYVPPPATPSQLTVTTVSTSRIDLAWTDNSNNETGFKIERKTGAGGNWTQIASLAANAAEYQDTGLTAGVSYYYRVTALGTGNNNSTATGESGATTLPNAPAAPSSLAAVTSGTQITLTWSRNSTNESGFDIERKTGAGGTYAQVGTVGTGITTFQDAGLSFVTTYYYRVKATNAGGDSAASNEVNATTTDEVILDNTDLNGVTITGSWTTSTAIAGYYKSNYLTSPAGSASSVTFTPNLPAAGQYQVFARWTTSTDRATNAPFAVVDVDGTHTVREYLRNNNGQWISLGLYNFTAGPGGSVRLSASTADGIVIADAVKFVKLHENSLATLSSANRLDYLLGAPASDPSIAPPTHTLTPAKDPRLEVKTDGSTVTSGQISPKVRPYQVGSLTSFRGDYWSDGGCVSYVPDTVNDPGLAATSMFAHYNGCFATSPRLEPYFSPANPDPVVRRSNVLSANGGVTPYLPIAIARPIAQTSNGAIVLFENGLMVPESTQTGTAIAAPIKFPANKKVLNVAVTSGNELALVTCHDTDRNVGQLAVVMIEAKHIAVHTLHQMGLYNQGSYSEFKLLGYVDLPVKWPTSIAAASNGFWGGPSATANLNLGQIPIEKNSTLRCQATEDIAAGSQVNIYYDSGYKMRNVTLTNTSRGTVSVAVATGTSASVVVNDTMRQSTFNNLTTGAWNSAIPNGGYAVVASTAENKAVFVNLAPLLLHIRSTWLTTPAGFDATVTARTAGTWPQTFDQNPATRPVIDSTFNVTAPTAVLAGHSRVQSGNNDKLKAYVAQRDGTLIIYDASHLIQRTSPPAAITELGRFFVGRNPTDMTFTRHNTGTGNAIFPSGKGAGGFHSAFYVTCRGERKVQQVITYLGKAAIQDTIWDSRLLDPVSCIVSERGYIVNVCDHEGKQLVAFRRGSLTDSNRTPAVTYPPADADGMECSGTLSLPGKPLKVTSTNVN
jgi:hypothetical protein